MKRIGHILLLLTILIAGPCLGAGRSPAHATTTAAGATRPSPPRTGVRHYDLSIDLGDFVSAAQLTTPSVGPGPWPTVILFHGSGPWDMDGTYRDRPDGPVLSTNLSLLAQRLGQHGIAVLRFNKRGVRADGSYDLNQIRRETTNQLIQDARVVIAATRTLAQVDRRHLFLYGWSQGAQVATHAAAADTHIAGVILQGPPTSGWSSILRYQLITNGLPALRHADADHDGHLSIAELIALPPGPATNFLRFYLWAPDSTPEQPKLNPVLDRNDDGKLSIDAELQPFLEAIVADPTLAGSPFLDPGNEPTQQIDDVLRTTRLPALILSGDADGWVPACDALIIKAAAPTRVQLRRYPGLGHALSPTTNPARDTFGVTADRPIDDIIHWTTREASLQ